MFRAVVDECLQPVRVAGTSSLASLVPTTSRSAGGAEPTGDEGMLHASYDDDICNVAGGGCLLDYP